jgi:hypothetical protein
MLIEKTVSLAVVLVWAGAASEKLRELEGRMTAQAATAERIARVEARLEDAMGQLARIEKKLDVL